MSFGNWFSDPLWEKINRENIEEYGTADIETIDLIKTYADKKVEAEADSKANEKVGELLPAIKEHAYIDAVKQVRSEFIIAEGVRIYGLLPFISETITFNGEQYDRNHFIPDRVINDPVNEEVRLYFDDTNDKWLVNVKNGLPKLISRFVVVACLIVDDSGPGMCRALVIFLKGEAKPLIFSEADTDSG